MHLNTPLALTLRQLLFFAIILSICAGCQRKPEDLEIWRPSVARNGQEKMEEWIASKGEPMDVRVRATEILLEEDLAYAADTALAKADEADRHQIVAELVPKVLEHYNTKDATVENYELGKSKQVVAKDSCFYLHKHSGAEEDKVKLEEALIDWLGTKLYIRDQMGVVKSNQIAEVIGKKSAPPLLKALEDPNNKAHEIAKSLRKLKDPEIDKKRAEALAKLGEAQIPKLDASIKAAILDEAHPAIAPLFIKLTNDTKVDGVLRTDAHFRIGKVLSKRESLKAYLFWVKQGPDDLRWLSIQTIAENQGKVGLPPILASLPEKANYGEGEPDGFLREAQRFCMGDVSELKANTESIFIKTLSSGTTPAKAVALKCLQYVGTAKGAKGAVNALAKDKTSIPSWDKLKTLGQLAEKTAKLLK